MNWTQATCALYVRLCNETGETITITEDELKFLEENRITSIDDLINVSQRALQNLEDSQRIKQEVLDIQARYESDRHIFLAVTKSPYKKEDYRTGEYDYRDYYHWLPLHESRLLSKANIKVIKDNGWEEILRYRYEEFNTLVHVTHIDKAKTIFKENHLQVNAVADNSVFSKIPGHPNQSTKVIWFGPGVNGNVKHTNSRYGNVAFCMDKLNAPEGLYSTELNYYFVEVIDYYACSACRILVTPKTYDHLKPYNPTKEGGPWYYNKETDQHYWLKDVDRYDGTRGDFRNSLEIMREIDTNPGDDFQRNLQICPVPHREKCIKGSCKFKGNYDKKFHQLVTKYEPIFPRPR